MTDGQRVVLTLILDNGKEMQLKSEFLHDLSVVKKLNDHTRIYFSWGEINPKSRDVYLRILAPETKIRVDLVKKDNKSMALFYGLLTGYDMVYIDQHYHLEAHGASETILLDKYPETRSFQDSLMNYGQLLEEVEKNYDKAVFSIAQALEGKLLERFTLQYDETTWQFLKRLASRFRTGLTPNPISEKPALCFGLPKGRDYTYTPFMDKQIIFRA